MPRTDHTQPARLRVRQPARGGGVRGGGSGCVLPAGGAQQRGRSLLRPAAMQLQARPAVHRPAGRGPDMPRESAEHPTIRPTHSPPGGGGRAVGGAGNLARLQHSTAAHLPAMPAYDMPCGTTVKATAMPASTSHCTSNGGGGGRAGRGGGCVGGAPGGSAAASCRQAARCRCRSPAGDRRPGRRIADGGQRTVRRGGRPPHGVAPVPPTAAQCCRRCRQLPPQSRGCGAGRHPPPPPAAPGVACTAPHWHPAGPQACCGAMGAPGTHQQVAPEVVRAQPGYTWEHLRCIVQPRPGLPLALAALLALPQVLLDAVILLVPAVAGHHLRGAAARGGGGVGGGCARTGSDAMRVERPGGSPRQAAIGARRAACMAPPAEMLPPDAQSLRDGGQARQNKHLILWPVEAAAGVHAVGTGHHERAIHHAARHDGRLLSEVRVFWLADCCHNPVRPHSNARSAAVVCAAPVCTPSELVDTLGGNCPGGRSPVLQPCAPVITRNAHIRWPATYRQHPAARRRQIRRLDLRWRRSPSAVPGAPLSLPKQTAAPPSPHQVRTVVGSSAQGAQQPLEQLHSGPKLQGRRPLGCDDVRPPRGEGRPGRGGNTPGGQHRGGGARCAAERCPGSGGGMVPLVYNATVHSGCQRAVAGVHSLGHPGS